MEVVNHGLMISFITLTCTDGQQLNKQYDHNDFQVDVPDSIGVSHGTCSLSVIREYLALEGGPPIFKQRFTCAALLDFT